MSSPTARVRRKRLKPDSPATRRPGPRHPRARTACRRDAEHFRVPPSLAGPKVVFLWCRACGYAPATVPPGGVCPKCGGHSWERYALSARLVPPAAGGGG